MCIEKCLFIWHYFPLNCSVRSKWSVNGDWSSDSIALVMVYLVKFVVYCRIHCNSLAKQQKPTNDCRYPTSFDRLQSINLFEHWNRGERKKNDGQTIRQSNVSKEKENKTADSHQTFSDGEKVEKAPQCDETFDQMARPSFSIQQSSTVFSFFLCFTNNDWHIFHN